MKKIALVLMGLVVLAGCHPDSITPAAPDFPAQNAAIIHAVFDPLGQGDKAVRVASCESGLNHNALSSGGTYAGLFQIGRHVVAIHAYGGNRLDPWANAYAARDLFVQRGNWSAWTCGNR